MSIFNHFQHLTLSTDQELALNKLESFITSHEQVFLLKGYAGSGKTTILKGLVEYLDSIGNKFVLMAPTGRAAKVIRDKTNRFAVTIHKVIYSYENTIENEKDGSFFFSYKIKDNKNPNGCIYIVDEASMLSDSKSETELFRSGTGSVLSDLITYTKITSIHPNNKIIFVGDPCQLPPVTDNSSKAFDSTYLKEKFNLSSVDTEMKEVKRQLSESGILKASSRLRKCISAKYYNDFNLRENSKDILNPISGDLLDIWQETTSSKIIIAYKNQTCQDLNKQIRERRYGNGDLPVQKGDIIIIGGNNYWKEVFNGEFAVVNKVSEIPIVRTIGLKGKESVRLTWREVELIFSDSDGDYRLVNGMFLENFLYGANSLKLEEIQALTVDFSSRYPNLKQKTDEYKEALMKDEFSHCLFIKFGYAVTCHKAQGGEWDTVFTIWDYGNQNDFNYFTDQQIKLSKDNENFYRWAYTAVTRASKTLYAVNPPFFDSYSTMTFIDNVVVNSLRELTGSQLKMEEIIVDEECNDAITKFNIQEQPETVQDHFIKLRYILGKQGFDLVGWEKKNLEIYYFIRKEAETAAFKTWVNKDFNFNGKYMIIPTKTNSIAFAHLIEPLFNTISEISLRREMLNQIKDFEFSDDLPFTLNLFEDLGLLFKSTDIYIDDIEHLQYKERYTFKRNQDIVVIDIEYNKSGFFGRVLSILNRTNSQMLVSDIQTILQKLKQE